MEEKDGLEPKTKLKLEIAYFIAAHKDLFKRLGIFLLIMLSIGLYASSIYRFINYFLDNKRYEVMIKKMITEVPNYEVYRKRNQPQALIVLSQSVIPLGSGRYDFVAEVKNPNSQWLAREVTYSFLGPNDENPQTDFILPKEESFLLSLAKEVQDLVPEPQISFVDIKWQKVKEPLGIQDNDFEIIEPQFISQTSFKTTDSSSVPARVTFKVKNKTIYDFWEAGFKIVLLQGTEIVGVNFISLEQLRSQEEKELEVIWLENVLRPTEIKIEPKINYLDPENYMPPKFFEGELK